jgi:hypothetical protein
MLRSTADGLYTTVSLFFSTSRQQQSPESSPGTHAHLPVPDDGLLCARESFWASLFRLSYSGPAALQGGR